MTDLMGIDVDPHLYDAVSVNRNNLQAEFCGLSAHLAYWGEMYAQAYREWLTAKLLTDQTEAALTIELRRRLEEERAGEAPEPATEDPSPEGKRPRKLPAPPRPKAVTESMVESSVNRDRRMVAVRQALIDAEVEKVRLYGVVDAIRSKRDMLVSLGAQMRAEMGLDPMLNREKR